MADDSEAIELQQQSKNLDDAPTDTNLSQENEVGVEAQAAAEGLRRSQRTRTLTEKGQELQESKSKKLKNRFSVTYGRWKSLAKEAKKALEGCLSDEILQDHINMIRCASADVRQAYEDLRQHVVPDGEIRRRVDTCNAVSRKILEWHKYEDKDEDKLTSEQAYWMETGSVFLSAASQGSSSISQGGKSTNSSSIKSNRSSLSSAKKQEAAAELAATQATLEVLQEMEREKQELESLEAENRQKLALQEAENAARQNALEEKRRQIERLETVKKMNAAKARLQVYEQEVSSDIEISELLHDCKPRQKKPALNSRSLSVQNVAQSHHATHIQPAVISKTDAREQHVNTHQEDNTTVFAKAIAESINASRLPIPEPYVFSGDPLRYKDWKMSFQTLIGSKNIPVNEKVYYLRKYVGGPAKKAIEGYFLIGTDAAYHSAWDVLEERYGSSFVIAKAFRDKLTSWPKIGPKDSVELREFSDFLRGCEAAMSQIRSLEVLNDCGENQRMLTKLPDWLTSRWNRKVIEIEEETKSFPSFSQFVEFVTREAKIACNPVTSLHALKSGDSERAKTPKTRSVGVKVLASSSAETPEVKACVFCEKSNHGIHTCRRFMDKSIRERVKFVQMKKLCFGCLKSGHHSKNCEKRSVCDTCKKKHPTCLHEDRAKEDGKKEHWDGEQKEGGKHVKLKERTEVKQTDEMPSEATSHRVVQDIDSTHTSSVMPVWLSTTSNPENEVLLYALLDNQSDTTFILQEKADNLDTQKFPVQLKLSTLSSRDTIIPSQKLTGLQVRGFYSSKKIALPATYTREFIPANLSHIPTPKTARAWPHLEHLADEIAPLIDCDVGLLIGYNCSQALLPREVVSGKDEEPFAQRTDLGWGIIGCVNPCVDYGDVFGSSHKIVVKQVTPCHPSSTKLNNEVRYIYRTQVKELVTPPDVLKALESDFNERGTEEAHFSQEDLRFISIMEEGITIKADGHCEMPLPFKKDKPSLSDNRKCAEHRLKCLKRRFEKDKQYHKDYVSFMNETIARGDAEKVSKEDIDKSPAWYIPHHGVYHPQKPGKIRVVFDCSAKFEGVSLNDHLLSGPELTNNLVGVLCRFRKGPVAVMCDIERMFHQFHVRAEDQDYLRFLWWDDGDFQSQPSIYRMRVHLFGAASSPGCANYGLRHIAAQGRGRFSEATIRFIERNFYVDDGLISVSTDEEAIQLISEARQLCSTGKLHIHKFISNRKEVLASLPREECVETVRHQDLALNESQIERALGVKWCVSSDQFLFRVTVNEHPLSRRGILSTVASIYDPLGFVAPFILVGKQILQQMCRDKTGWDEPLSDDLRSQWESWLLDLRDLADVKIQRCYLPTSLGKVQRYELHHFSDASVTGYGECTYLRAVSATRQIHCSLVMGKARVAPTKVTTVPRLELTAAVVAVRTSDLLRKELELEEVTEVFWTDSKVVLGYVNNEARRFHVFVANRIQRIKESTDPSQWRYVASEENPADHASRGLRSKDLIASNWFTGPTFLWQDELPSRDIKVGEIAVEDPEMRKAFVCKVLTTEDSLLDRFLKFSSWTRLVKAIARLLRRIKELKGLASKTNEATSLEERKDAELAIIAIVQKATFSEEIQSLKCKKEITAKRNRLHRLCPFLDERGILRVGGRLEHAALHPHIKHPAILPRTSHISTLLIKHYHQQVQHQGRGITINELRSNGIWILGCSHAVSSCIYKCVKCRKFRRCTEDQKMSDLPRERMETTPPFTYCGVDCFGPFYIKEGRRELKRYGLLFTCLCSRAVHIELLDDMTADAFINALRAFIALRGNVRQLRSDQGTNFIGARREFLEAVKEMDQECLKQLGCEFVMNPPSASHMGGAWERQIRTIRSVLTSILDQSSRRLDSSSMRTYLYEVMAIINSRPLTAHLLNDPTGPQPLTPNHILMMKSSVVLPPPGEFVKEDLYLRKRWRSVQQLANEFWSRWKKEYLLNLQQRQKWHKTQRNARTGDVVIVQDDFAPRNAWKLAKVTEVYPSKDGCVRKLQLLISDSALDDQGKRLTKPTYLVRPIHKTVTLLEAE
ncbi:uncharacterized protein LOC127537608 [Acanthochromis polyacanthus]|uniref:uncharacterized protein LOC127537608 n=1 Tax=Acanthochromis polyacanthus TaxID=80966 RepID=UPI0022340737|nr:uncharacterized protein LOC127537608 [Acanthochromis polyacanthus]